VVRVRFPSPAPPVRLVSAGHRTYGIPWPLRATTRHFRGVSRPLAAWLRPGRHGQPRNWSRSRRPDRRCSGGTLRTVRVVEIAELLGVSHQRASKIVDEPGFPDPVGREGQSRLWDGREVAALAKRWRAGKPWR